jgi:DNA replication protein DnaC
MNDALATTLKQLRLSGLLQTLDVRLQEAAGHQLGHAEFLELVLQDELAVRSDRQLQRRTKAASFREPKTLDAFDWSFNPSLKRKQIYDLATGRFIREARDVLLLGPPGVGKSHLVQAIGHQALRAGFVVLYRSIFDVVRDFLQDEAGVDDSKPANAPIGKGRKGGGSKPANAPIGSEAPERDSKPANAPIGSPAVGIDS